jgi:hypothetical protein
MRWRRHRERWFGGCGGFRRLDVEL